MSISNRSGLQCMEHPSQQISNICIAYDCLKPLCPDCVQTHSKLHSQQIQSWKHCITKSSKNIKSTLQTLKQIYDDQSKYKPYKDLETVENQNIKLLYNVRNKIIKMVEETFITHQKNLRSFIRTQYKVDMPDTAKLRLAIEQMEKLLMKLAHAGTVLPAIKKSVLLDHQSLMKFFGDMRKKQYHPINQTFVVQSHQLYPKLKSLIDSSLSLSNVEPSRISYQSSSPTIFEALKISVPNYFSPSTNPKLLHFFIPPSNELKILDLQLFQKGSSKWKTLQFEGKKELPSYFKSIITPQGEIYLTGGSLNGKRCKEIYHYNFTNNTLDLVCKMKYQRSSHSITYANGLIYLIGGFSNVQTDVTRTCQIFNLKQQKCTEISPLNAPSANSCATSFNDQYIFKIGGVQNKDQGNNLIEMYSIRKNKWVVVDIQSDRSTPQLELLSFSASIQLNPTQLMVFGGYDNSQMQKPQRLCYTLQIMVQKGCVRVKNYNTTPLAYAEGFWNNNPYVHNGRVVALQNVTDQQDQLTAIADERRVIVFDGDRWG